MVAKDMSACDMLDTIMAEYTRGHDDMPLKNLCEGNDNTHIHSDTYSLIYRHIHTHIHTHIQTNARDDGIHRNRALTWTLCVAV